MIINQNLSALGTFNALTKNTKATEKAIGNLSTGRRINSAADDAAGLAITEKMRGQISGLKQASSNAQNGISLLQTGEGGLDQTHSILQRMRALAVQSATDTNTSDDRQKIQGEVDQLAKEISRISNTTEFNTQNLLAGGMSDTFHVGANANQNLSVSITAMDAQSLGVASSINIAASVSNNAKVNISSVSRGLSAGTTRVAVVSVNAATLTKGVTQTSSAATVSATGFSIRGTGTTGSVSAYTGTVDANYMVKIASTSSTATTVNSISYSTDNGTSWTTVNGDFRNTATTGVAVDGMKFQFDPTTTPTHFAVGDTWTFSVSAANKVLQLRTGALATGTNVGSTVTVHKGDTTATVGDSDLGKTASLQFDYAKVTAASTIFYSRATNSTAAVLNNGSVATNATVVAGLDVSTQANANNAITTIDKAINAVSQQRSQLGAYQNRLTNTIDNLNTSNENITASESRIRDVDMASEMSTYQKNNILQSAATAMLAKANQQPQSVLQLLQG